MKRFGLVLSCAGALAACFSPDDILIVEGRVASPEPAGQVVRLLRGKPLEPDRCWEFAAFKETTTDADGRYAFEVFRAQAQGLTDGVEDRCFRVEANFTSGARASTVLLRLFGPERLPPLPDWRPAMRLDAGVLEFAPVVDPLPGDTLEGDLVTHRLEARADDGSLAWRQEDRVYEAEPEVGAPSRLPLTFDPEILVEDRPLTLRLHANVLRRSSDVAPGFGGGRGSGLPVEVAAGELLRLSARTAPPSRGSTCDGGPCAFTDGDYRPVPPPGFPPTGVSVTFPTPLTPRWVILRGLAPMRGAVEVVLTGADGGAIYTGRTPSRVFDWPSADGELANQPLDGGYIPDALTLFVAMPIDAGMEASGLRMGDDTAPLYLLGEVSVLE